MQTENVYMIRLKNSWFLGQIIFDKDIAKKGCQIAANAHQDTARVFQYCSNPRMGAEKVEERIASGVFQKVQGRLFVQTDIVCEPVKKEQAA